ncbi:hypothetical protein Trydic_g9072 [Trypoxylus dichotomus]
MSSKRIDISYDDFERILSEAIRILIDKYRTDIRHLHCELKRLNETADKLRKIIEDYIIRGKGVQTRQIEVQKVPKYHRGTVEHVRRKIERREDRSYSNKYRGHEED